MRNHMCIMRFCYDVKETVWNDENYLLLFYSTTNRFLLCDKNILYFILDSQVLSLD